MNKVGVIETKEDGIDGSIKAKNAPTKKWFQIRRNGNEREINLFVVVETFRFIFYLWFLLVIIVGILLTLTLSYEPEYKKIIRKLFGSINVCVFFDYPPATYVLPSLYAVWPVIVFQYAILSIFRAWISMEERHITKFSFVLYSVSFIYFWISSAIFSTSVAIQPVLEKPETVMLHTLPFTNLVLSLTFLQLAITWFGFKVSWKNLKMPRFIETVTVVFMISLSITSILKITQHLNGVLHIQAIENEADEKKSGGKWWSVDDNNVMSIFCQIVDAIWFISVLFWPMVQSGYLMWRNRDTHGLIITIEDNRDGRSPRCSANYAHSSSRYKEVSITMCL